MSTTYPSNPTLHLWFARQITFSRIEHDGRHRSRILLSRISLEKEQRRRDSIYNSHEILFGHATNNTNNNNNNNNKYANPRASNTRVSSSKVAFPRKSFCRSNPTTIHGFLLCMRPLLAVNALTLLFVGGAGPHPERYRSAPPYGITAVSIFLIITSRERKGLSRTDGESHKLWRNEPISRDGEKQR